METSPKIGLALSGGGSRAIAFHLGCLRKLHELGILQKVSVISAVSGGSVIATAYVQHTGTFEEFEAKMRGHLNAGFVGPALVTACTTLEGLRALVCLSLHAFTSPITIAMRGVGNLYGFVTGTRVTTSEGGSILRRFASRTTILRRTFNDVVFEGGKLADLPSGKPKLIVVASELRTGSAFYFSSASSGSWRMGTCLSRDITLADAVAASAAYPLFLPAIDEVLPFQRRDGTRVEERIIVSDGGVYDNLGLSPLWPGRDANVSVAVEDVDIILCCRAGYGPRYDPPTSFFISRIKQAFYTVHERAQNAAMTRLFDLKSAGKLTGFAIAHLGQRDDRLKFAPADLITGDQAFGYPTNFSAMPTVWIDLLSNRGAQLIQAVLKENLPQLISVQSTV